MKQGLVPVSPVSMEWIRRQHTWYRPPLKKSEVPAIWAIVRITQTDRSGEVVVYDKDCRDSLIATFSDSSEFTSWALLKIQDRFIAV